MAGGATAVTSGTTLRTAVMAIGQTLGLEASKEVYVGRRLWGAKRMIDVVLTHPTTRQRLGVECKYQGGGGSAEEKIPATIEDIRSWPIQGIVVFSGLGFSPNMKAFLLSTGKAVELPDLDVWLRFYFGLELNA
jgi:hypothetical protein